MVDALDGIPGHQERRKLEHAQLVEIVGHTMGPQELRGAFVQLVGQVRRVCRVAVGLLQGELWELDMPLDQPIGVVAGRVLDVVAGRVVRVPRRRAHGRQCQRDPVQCARIDARHDLGAVNNPGQVLNDNEFAGALGGDGVHRRNRSHAARSYGGPQPIDLTWTGRVVAEVLAHCVASVRAALFG